MTTHEMIQQLRDDYVRHVWLSKKLPLILLHCGLDLLLVLMALDTLLYGEYVFLPFLCVFLACLDLMALANHIQA